jgi:DNA polymerase elongation subunit (family B)
MIINIEQKAGKLIISYVKKDGALGFSQLNIPPNQQYIYTYAQKNKGIPGLLSWDFKPIRKTPTTFLNKYRIQEFFIDAGEEITKHLFEANMPNFAAADIEVEVTDEGFAEPEFANNRITAISFSKYPEITVFGSKPLSGEECKTIEDNINEHVKKFQKQYRFIYKYHSNEADMIYDFLYNYVRPAPLISGWNFWGYDWRYIMKRSKNLNMDVSWLSPTRQWYEHRIKDRNKDAVIMLPQHKLIVDYMAIYQKWDRTVEVKENNTLDFVAEEALGIKKVKYPGTLQDLYNKDYLQFVFYSAIDSVIIELLNDKLKTMSTFLGLGNITKVEAMSAFSPIAMLEATLTRYAYKRNQVFPKKENRSERETYEGAFVFEPIPNLYEWVAAFDFASLYPSIMRQFKISIENFLFKDKSYSPKETEIKCSSGAVFDAAYEPLLSEILSNYYTQRKEAKKISLNAEKEADELQKILRERKISASASIN